MATRLDVASDFRAGRGQREARVPDTGILEKMLGQSGAAAPFYPIPRQYPRNSE